MADSCIESDGWQGATCRGCCQWRDGGGLHAQSVAELGHRLLGRVEVTVNPESPRLFFSYSRADAEFALGLARDLRSAGVSLWVDQLDIAPGDHWDRAVEVALQNSSSVLLVLSPTSVSSTNVMDEVSFALNKHKRIVPVLFRSCNIPLRLHRLQYIEFTTDYARGLKQLLQALEAMDRVSAPADQTAKAAEHSPDTDPTGLIENPAEVQSPAQSPAHAGEPLVPELATEPENANQERVHSSSAGAQVGAAGREMAFRPATTVASVSNIGVIGSSDTRLPRSDGSSKDLLARRRWYRLIVLTVCTSLAFFAATIVKVKQDGPVNSASIQQVSKLPATPKQEPRRFTMTECGSIQDAKTRLEWYVGPDKTMSWDEARTWIESLKGCDGRWEMPTISQLSTLYDRKVTAGTGFPQDGKYFQAHIDPVFAKIGAGAWVWSREAKNAKIARSFNFNQGIAVEYEKNATTYTTRAFAVRQAAL